jgi:hypothetical protein
MPRIGINQDGELDLPNKMYGTALNPHSEIAASQQSIKAKTIGYPNNLIVSG